MKIYTKEEGLKVLFITEQEFSMMREAGTASFLYSERSNIIAFNEKSLKRFFKNEDELTKRIKTKALERFLAAKEQIETTQKILGW